MLGSTLKKMLFYIAIITLFFISGFCGLVYELLWLRLLGIVFGNTTFAMGTVLTAFMAGLALGSFYFGKTADKQPEKTLKIYGFLEISIGIYALITPLLFYFVEQIHIQLHQVLEPGFITINLLRFILSLLVLILPATLMGGTLPLIIRSMTVSDSELSKKTGITYAANTFGAVAGILITLYCFLPFAGIKLSLQIVGIINIAVGLAAITIDKFKSKKSNTPTISEQPAATTPKTPHQNHFILLATFAVSGFCGMALQIIWTRILTPISGSSVYAFGMILATYLVGIAAGSMIFSHLFSHRKNHFAFFTNIQLLLGAAAFFFYPHFFYLAEKLITLNQFTGISFASQQLNLTLLTATVIIIPTLLFGATFPAAVAAFKQSQNHMGQTIGSLYSSNTTGAILGSFITSFILLPILGTRTSLLIIAALLLFNGIILLLKSPKKTTFTQYIVLGLVLISFMVFLQNKTNRARAILCLDDISKMKETRDVESQTKNKEIVFLQEGINSTISVHQDKLGRCSMAVNGRTNGSVNSYDMYTQLLLGHLPMVFHENPQKICLIGLGTGITLGAVATHQPKFIDCVEMEPIIKTVAQQYFAKENRNVMKNPLVNMIYEDGRNHILTSKEKYDVIISEPSHLWSAGVASLYTTEHYQNCKKRLTENGILCQWFHLYQTSPEDVLLLLNTINQEFDKITLWFPFPTDIMIIAQTNNKPFSHQILEKHWNNNLDFQTDMKQFDVTSAGAFYSHFLLENSELQQVLATTNKTHNDNLPLLEFNAPKAVHISTKGINFQGLKQFKVRNFPILETSEIDFRDSPNLDFELAEAYNYKKLNNTSLLLYQSAMQKFPLKEIIPMKIAIHFYEEKNAAYALKAVERALSLNPDYSDAIQLKALILEKQGYTKQAQQLLEENLSKHPKHQKSLIALAELFFSQQNFEEAAKTYEKCIINEAETSEIAIKAYFTAKQGYCHFKNNDYSLALALVEKALQLEPDHLPAIQTQGELLFAMGKPEKAIQVLTELIKINSDSDEARFILAKHFIKNGDREKGSNILQPILKKFPYHKEVFQLLNQ